MNLQTSKPQPLVHTAVILPIKLTPCIAITCAESGRIIDSIPVFTGRVIYGGDMLIRDTVFLLNQKSGIIPYQSSYSTPKPYFIRADSIVFNKNATLPL